MPASPPLVRKTYMNPETQDLGVSLETLVALSPLLGYNLVDRSAIRKGQEPALLADWSVSLPPSHLPAPVGDRFFYGSVDWMVAEEAGRPVFYVVEVNGSNAAGLTDVPVEGFDAVAASVAGSLNYADVTTPCVIVNSYTGDKNINVHERAVLAEAIRAYHPDKRFVFRTTADFAADAALPPVPQDAIMVMTGPISAMLPRFSLQHGRLHLADLPVAVIINDLTVDRILKALPDWADCMATTLVLNRIHPFSNLKARAYRMLNEVIVPALSERFPIRAFPYWEAPDEPALQAISRDLVLREQRSVVIKPYSSSVGVGIQFLHAGMDEAAIAERVTRSLEESGQRYAATSDIFPYTLCEFVETRLAQFPKEALVNRKFDLRFFVCRDGEGLRAMPAVAKLASAEYDTDAFHREGLQTNTMRVAQGGKARPMAEVFGELIRPLNNRQTLEGLRLAPEDIRQLSELSARVVGYLAGAV